jgi:hypothetical protein
MMRAMTFTSLLLLLLSSLLAACAPGAISRATPTTARNTITDYAALVEAFKAEGTATQSGEEIADPVFSVKERALDLPNARLQVMEYPTEADAQAAAATISPDGFGVGNATVDWVDAPHLYRVNRLIVLYVGRDKTTLDLLQRVLGRQFAGAPPDQPTPTIVYAPTVAPPTPAPTFNATPDPRTPTMISPDIWEATVSARATTSPFPTAGAVEVKPGAPASVTARRAWLSIRVELPKDNYLAGEGGRAQVTLRNDGQETVWINGTGSQAAQVILLDEQGHQPPPYPWFSAPRPGFAFEGELAPGEVITATINFHGPPLESASSHSYVLWAWTQFSRVAPENGNGPDNLWLHMESGPIPLRISMPNPTQQLIAKLNADRSGWRVKVTDGRGHVPNSPMWGAMEAATYESFYAGPLNEKAEGEWSGTWPDHIEGNETVVRAWVSAPGYVTAIASVMVPGNRSGKTMFEAQPPPRSIFPSVEAAQAALNLPLYKPKQLPPDAALDRVEVEDNVYDHNRNTSVSEIYPSAGNSWLELMQLNSTEEYAGAGWGRARYDPEARQVTVSGSTAYLVKQFDWWILDWKVGNVGFELQAPARVISLEQLLNIAQSVQP